jgi:phosphoglycerate dehydrogenase-like enzyme
MAEELRVGILWDALAQRHDLVRRIAETSGAEPIVWDGTSPAPNVDALISDNTPPSVVPAETPRLRLLQLGFAGVDNLRQHPIWQSEVVVASATGVHGVQIPEHVMLLLLALRRDLPRFIDAQQRHAWEDAWGAPGELRGLTLGLIGFGHIGKGIAHLARAFGMRVLATSLSTRMPEPLSIPGVSPFVDLPAVPPMDQPPDELWPLARLHELLAASDALVICAPLTPATRGMIDAECFRHVKPTAQLINIARGKIVDEQALIQALREGRLAGAGLDVTDEEPLPADSPLWDLPNVIITPHISGNSAQYLDRAVNIFLANLECLRRGERPITAVDRERGY